MKKILLALIAATFFMNALAADRESRFFEMRTYHAAPGKLDELNSRFRNHTLKLFEKHGMTNIGYWVPVDNTNNLLIYLLAYPDREAREKSWKEFSGDPEWLAVRRASEASGKLVEKADSVFLTATDFSPPVLETNANGTNLYELRTYHAAPGKLDRLLARFRDHTVALFQKHNLRQVGYWTPVEKKDGAGATLIYILAHKDKAAADASWKAFREDAEWVRVKAESEADGPLTEKGGVVSVYMVPTDYSPAK